MHLAIHGQSGQARDPPNKLRSRFDVVVIGAGPSGSSAAYRLAQKGFKTLLVEMESLPRTKSCAGMLPPKIRRAIKIPHHLVQRPIEGYMVFAPGESATIRFPHDSGYTVDRGSFDLWLAEEAVEAGSRLMQGANVLGIKQAKRDTVVFTTSGRYYAKYVVGADGVRSRMRKSLGLHAPSKDQLAFTYQMVFEQDERIIDEIIGNYFHTHYDVSTVREGYLWVSPHRKRLFLGFGTPLGEVQITPRGIIRGFTELERVKLLIKDAKLIKEEAYLIPNSGPYEELGRGRILFVGDAGGFTHPFTGEGIYYAILSGQAAAEAISTHKLGDELTQLYEQIVEKYGLLRLRGLVEERKVKLRGNEAIRRYVQGLKILSTHTS